jgi:hypothetical protein
LQRQHTTAGGAVSVRHLGVRSAWLAVSVSRKESGDAFHPDHLGLLGGGECVRPAPGPVCKSV